MLRSHRSLTTSAEAERDRDSLTAHSSPNQLGPDYCAHVLESFAKFVAPELGWKPNWEGKVEGNAI